MVLSQSVEALSLPPCFFRKASKPFSAGYFSLPINTTGHQRGADKTKPGEDLQPETCGGNRTVFIFIKVTEEKCLKHFICLYSLSVSCYYLMSKIIRYESGFKSNSSNTNTRQELTDTDINVTSAVTRDTSKQHNTTQHNTTQHNTTYCTYLMFALDGVLCHMWFVKTGSNIDFVECWVKECVVSELHVLLLVSKCQRTNRRDTETGNDSSVPSCFWSVGSLLSLTEVCLTC